MQLLPSFAANYTNAAVVCFANSRRVNHLAAVVLYGKGDFSGKTNAISCLPFGVSEDPNSPFFANMLPLYASRQFKPAWFFPDELKANAGSELILTPE